MPAADAKRLEALVASRSYPELEGELARLSLGALAKAWASFKPLQRLVLFKLLDAPRALELYHLLPFDEKYLLLCGFPLAAIAPVIEDLPAAARRPFVSLPRECYETMSGELVRESRARAEAGA